MVKIGVKGTSIVVEKQEDKLSLKIQKMKAFKRFKLLNKKI